MGTFESFKEKKVAQTTQEGEDSKIIKLLVDIQNSTNDLNYMHIKRELIEIRNIVRYSKRSLDTVLSNLRKINLQNIDDDLAKTLTFSINEIEGVEENL